MINIPEIVAKEETVAISKSTLKLSVLVVIALVVGLSAGYFIGAASVTGNAVDNAENQVAQQPSAQQQAQQPAQQPAAQEPAQQPAAQEPSRVSVSTDDDPSKGDAKAPVTIVEFSDFQCPFCGRFYTQTLPELQKNYIDTGKVRFVYRDLPLDSIHPQATPAALAAECADEQGKFWQYHDKIFQNQASLSDASYKQWAKEVGMNEQQFSGCYDTKKYSDEVKKDTQDGTSYGVRGTPSFFVNGVLLRGAQPYSSFKTAIDAELARLNE